MTSTLVRIAGVALVGWFSTASATALDDVSRRLEQGEYALALSLLEQAPDKQQARVRFLRSSALAGAGKTDEAADILRSLIKEHPEWPEPYNNLAAIHAQRGELEEAKSVLERALQTNPAYATVYENISTIYVEMARRSYAKALHAVKGSADVPQLTVLAKLAHEVEEAEPAPTTVASAPSKMTPASEPKRTASEPKTAPSPPVAPSKPAGSEPKKVQSTAAVTKRAIPEVPVRQVNEKIAAAAREPLPVVTPKPTVEAPAETAEKTQKAAEAGIQQRKQAAMAALKRWANAWSEQDVKGYLSAYAPGFVPDNGVSRKRWEAMRRSRLQSPDWIEVSLSDFDIKTGQEGLVVELTQDYAANNYRDRSRKRFELVNDGDEWRIESEQTVKIIR